MTSATKVRLILGILEGGAVLGTALAQEAPASTGVPETA